MRKISKPVLRALLAEPHICARAADGGCKGRLTLEHAFIYSGKQIDEVWAIIWLCAYHHAVDEFQDGGDLDKDKNRFIALSRATDADVAKYPRVDWDQMRLFLSKKFESE